MLITAIEPRKKGLSQLYIDGEKAMKLDTETLLKEHIKAGMEIDDEELLELVKKSEARRASEKALYLLEHRNHSKKELADKIARVTSKEAAIAAAEHMEEIGLVNDESFARSYAHDLFILKKYGVQRVKQELFRKGVDKDIIDNVIEEFKYDIPTEENIKSILERRYRGYSQDEKIRRRAIAALQRMGYRFDEIKSAINYREDEFYE